jgi:hypothetical protein
VLCSWESPFADCLSGAPNGDYLSRAIVPCRGAPITDTAHMGLTSSRWITITGMMAHPRGGAHRHQAGCRVAVERAADRHTFICDGPLCVSWGFACRGRGADRGSQRGPTPTEDSGICSFAEAGGTQGRGPGRRWGGRGLVIVVDSPCGALEHQRPRVTFALGLCATVTELPAASAPSDFWGLWTAAGGVYSSNDPVTSMTVLVRPASL